MEIKIADFFDGKPSFRGLPSLMTGLYCCFILLIGFLKAGAQNDPYIISQNDEAKLIFLRPQQLEVKQKGFDVLADFTVILRKSDIIDSVRMSFTLSAPKPVFKWNGIELKMRDSSYKYFTPSRIYQEKNRNRWDNRYEVLMPVMVFQQLISLEKDPQIVFSFDDITIEATFNKKQAKILTDLGLQIQVDLNH